MIVGTHGRIKSFGLYVGDPRAVDQRPEMDHQNTWQNAHAQ